MLGFRQIRRLAATSIGSADVRLKAVVSENVKPGVAWSPSLWWHRDSPTERNVNALTSDRLTDMGGGSTLHTNLIQFARAEG
jgi:anaerobic selenocysteine-containing dehydrogenase